MRYLLIDSNYRTSDSISSTNFKIQLYKAIKITKYLKLMFASIPNTSYTFNNNNNTFKITFNDATIKNVVIPIGNYDVSSLASTIVSLVNYSAFNIIFNQQTYKYTFSSS